MSEHNTEMSGGNSYGGINIGSNKGSVTTTQGAQQQGIEQTNITGMAGGQAETVIAAGHIHGNAADRSTHHHGRTGATFNQCTNAAETQSGPNTFNMGGGSGQTAAQAPTKDLEAYSVDDIQKLLKENGLPEPVLKSFKDSKIKGEFFVNLDDAMLKELGVESAIDNMKIRTLQTPKND